MKKFLMTWLLVAATLALALAGVMVGIAFLAYAVTNNPLLLLIPFFLVVTGCIAGSVNSHA